MRVNLSTNKCCWIWYKGFWNYINAEKSGNFRKLRSAWFFKSAMRETTHKFSTAQKMKFSTKEFFSKCDQIHSFLPIWSQLLKKPLLETSFFVQCWFHDTSVTDWWLWGWKESWCTIPALNVVKVIEKSQPEYLLISIEDEEKLLSLLNLICSSKRLSTTVNTRANSIIIPAGKLVQIPCKAEIGVIESMKYYYLRKLIVLIHLWHWKKEQRASSRYQ